MTSEIQLPEGFRLYRGHLSLVAQFELLEAISKVIASAPLYVPVMPKTGRPMSVQMTNCGSLGWVTCKDHGYRYQATHPETGTVWPAIPLEVLEIWQELCGVNSEPEACLINWYEPGAKLGLHVDRDEQDMTTPVLSVSLGDDAYFRLGGLARRDKTSRLLLRSGDVLVMGGASRLCHHGIDRILSGTGALLPQPGRFNLTLRRVTPVGDSGG